MKKLIKLCTVLMLLLMSVLNVYAEGDETTDSTSYVTFNGEDGFDLSNNGDLFDNFKGIMPGDELDQTIVVKNASEDTVKIYVQAVVHDESNQPVTADATSDESNDLLKEFKMTVFNGTQQIYEESPDKTDGLSEPVLLGQFEPGQQVELKAHLSIPTSLGNEFANREGEVDWIFTAVKLIDVKVTKIWEDNDNNDGMRPDSVTIKLLANGEEVATYELVEKEDWTHVFEDLPAADIDGKKIEYTVEETPVENYEDPVYEKVDEEGYEWTITNKHEDETVDIHITVEWDDEDDKDKIRPDEVTVTIYDEDDNPIITVTLSSDGDWKKTVEDLLKYKDGKEIKYHVGENPVKGYSTEYGGDMGSGFVITNTHRPEPDTGDTNNLTLWGILLGGSVVGVALLLMIYRKKKVNI